MNTSAVWRLFKFYCHFVALEQGAFCKVELGESFIVIGAGAYFGGLSVGEVALKLKHKEQSAGADFEFLLLGFERLPCLILGAPVCGRTVKG